MPGWTAGILHAQQHVGQEGPPAAYLKLKPDPPCPAIHRWGTADAHAGMGNSSWL